MEWEAGVAALFGVRLVFCDDCAAQVRTAMQAIPARQEAIRSSVAQLDWMDQHGRHD